MKRLIRISLCILLCLTLYVKISDYVDLDISSVTSEKNKDTEKKGIIELRQADINSNNFRYYFNSLSDDNRKIYNEIYYILYNRLDFTELTCNDKEIVQSISQCVMWDNPEIYFVSHCKYKETTVENKIYVSICGVYIMTENEQKYADTLILEYKDKCLSRINEGMSEYDKALYLYEYVINNTEYELDSKYNQSMYSAIIGKSVCLEYTKVYKYMCDLIGLKSIIVTGYNEVDAHAWNMVEIEGEWCYIDCTFGDNEYVSGSGINYIMFGVDKQELLRNYNIDNVVTLPESKSIKNDYYRNGIYFEEYDKNRIKRLLNSEKGVVTIKCNSECTFNDIYNTLIVEKNIFSLVNSTDININCTSDENTLSLFFKLY